jgi:WS/DGAT/MGAT family acyltransferase
MSEQPTQDDRDMTAFDAFLFRGDDDPRTRAELVVVYVLDRLPDRQRFIDTFDRASRLILRLRQKVVAPPVPLFLPSWVVDPDFDLGRHLRFGQLPAPGSLADVLDAAQAEVTTPLDNARPLWEAVLLDGFEGGRAAVIIKMSHAVTDGIGALELFATLIDAIRSPDKGPMPRAPIPEDVTPGELLNRSLARLPAGVLGATLQGGRQLAASVMSTHSLQSTLASAVAFAGSLGRIFGPHGKPSPLLAGRSLRRRCAAFEVQLDDMKRAGKAVGASVNDVYLGCVTAALRRYHEALGETADTLPMAIPVNLRTPDDPAAGNHFGAILMAAPIGVKDASERLEVIGRAVREGRTEPAIGAIGMMAPVLARLPTAALRSIAGSTPKPDVQASNIPGPKTPIYIAGTKILKCYAFGPVPGVAAMFTMQSIAGTCFIGVNYDPAAITRADLFARSLVQGFRETLRLATAKPRISAVTVGRNADQEMIA